MATAIELFTQLNDISSSILDEFKKEEPSLEFIQDQLNQRDTFVNGLKNMEQEFATNGVSASDKEAIQASFKTFSDLNNEIQQKADALFKIQKEKLGGFTNQRKAAEQYAISNRRNIL
ncbi:MAG: hypothetical protein AAFW89_05955 [Bacteroidota bacterium]